jgi:hypothetical protein
MDYFLGAAPAAARRLSGVLGRTTDLCVAASAATMHMAPAFLVPTCAVVTRGVGGGAMAIELCHTLLVNGVMAEHDGEMGVEMRPSRHASRIWTSIFAGLARVISTGEPVTPEFGAHYRAVLSHTRRWVFAYTSRDLDGAVVALAGMQASVVGMAHAAPRAAFVRNLLDVLGVWLQFTSCLSRAAATAHTGDKSARHVEEWLQELASRSLSEYEMHAVCWVLEGVRDRMDVARLGSFLALFAPHGIEAGRFDQHAAAALIAISDLAG